MEKFWKAFFAAVGIGAIMSFVFYSLYKQWFTPPILERLSPHQAFVAMVIFLVLSVAALMAGVLAWMCQPILPPPGSVALPGEPTASREFFIGRWDVQPKAGETEGGSHMEYFEDGRFEGVVDQFAKSERRRTPAKGTWELLVVCKDKFYLTVNFEGREPWMGYF